MRHRVLDLDLGMEFRYTYRHDSLNILMTFKFRVCAGVGCRVWGVGCGVQSFGKGLDQTYRRDSPDMIMIFPRTGR